MRAGHRALRPRPEGAVSAPRSSPPTHPLTPDASPLAPCGTHGCCPSPLRPRRASPPRSRAQPMQGRQAAGRARAAVQPGMPDVCRLRGRGSWPLRLRAGQQRGRGMAARRPPQAQPPSTRHRVLPVAQQPRRRHMEILRAGIHGGEASPLGGKQPTAELPRRLHTAPVGLHDRHRPAGAGGLGLGLAPPSRMELRPAPPLRGPPSP